MLSHPDYPSLLSLADTLERLGIDHQVGKIEEEQLSDAPFPYMLQLDRRGAELLLIKDQQDLAVHKKDLEHWKGVVIKLEPTDAIADDEHNKQLAQEKLHRRLTIILVTALFGLLIVPLILSTTLLTALLLGHLPWGSRGRVPAAGQRPGYYLQTGGVLLQCRQAHQLRPYSQCRRSHPVWGVYLLGRRGKLFWLAAHYCRTVYSLVCKRRFFFGGAGRGGRTHHAGHWLFAVLPVRQSEHLVPVMCNC